MPRKRNWPGKQYCGEYWICLQQTRACGDFVRTAEGRRAFVLFFPLFARGEDGVQLSRQRANQVIEAESPAHRTAHSAPSVPRHMDHAQRAAMPAAEDGAYKFVSVVALLSAVGTAPRKKLLFSQLRTGTRRC